MLIIIPSHSPVHLFQIPPIVGRIFRPFIISMVYKYLFFVANLESPCKINARGCQDSSYSLKIRLMHFYINTLPLGVSFPIAIELMLITPISFELCPILCFDLGVFNNFGVFINS